MLAIGAQNTAPKGSIVKINVDVDISPEELRRFMGLPDVQGIQQQMMDAFAENTRNGMTNRQAQLTASPFVGQQTDEEGVFKADFIGTGNVTACHYFNNAGKPADC